VTLRARSCPTCHSIGEPRALTANGWTDLPAADPGGLTRCTDPWHEPRAELERQPAVPTDPAGSLEPETRYRVGRKVGRTIYRNNVLIGVMDTPELARLAVDGMTTRNCGHDLEAFQRQADELARLRDELTTTRVSLSLSDQERIWNRQAYEQAKAERDHLAGTVRRVRELAEAYRDGRTVGLIRHAVAEQMFAALDASLGDAETGQRDEDRDPHEDASEQVRRLNGPMLARLRKCAADTSPNYDGRVTIYPPEARELISLIDALLSTARPDELAGSET
jgi:hypothetical protein